MPKRKASIKRTNGFQGNVASLVDTLREVKAKLHARIYLLVTRDKIMMTERHFRRTSRQKRYESLTGCARRQKEVFKQKRESIVRQANYISSRYHANVWIYITRNRRWYSHEVIYLKVSVDRPKCRRQLANGRRDGRIPPTGSPRARHFECVVENSPGARMCRSRRAQGHPSPSRAWRLVV